MKRRGFTVIEVCVAVTLLSLVVGPMLVVLLSGSRYYKKESTRSEVHSSLEIAMHRLARELIGVQVTSMLPDPTGISGSPNLTFQTVTGIDGLGLPILGPIMNLTLRYENDEANDGVDNDGDGLIDECQLVWTRDVGGPTQVTTVVCSSVREYLEGESFDNADENGNGLRDERGFHVSRVGNVLNFRLTVETMDNEGQLVTTTSTSAVVVRS